MINSSVSDYKNWLINLVIDEDHSCYNNLLNFIFNKEFHWSVPRDENRAIDGIHLRNVFADQYGYSSGMDGPCTVLEMMIALAVRGAEDILWDGENNWTPFIFWSMINNLGLIDSVDSNFYQHFVEVKIDIFLDRKYDENGVGGLFLPSQFYSQIPKKWSHLEVWDQMNDWINDIF